MENFMKSLLITILMLTSFAKAGELPVNMPKQSFCTQTTRNEIEIVNGKGTITATEIATGKFQVVHITSISNFNMRSEPSDNSIWNVPVLGTEDYFIEGSVNNETGIHTGGLIKFYLKGGDIAMLLVTGELQPSEDSNLGTQKSCN
jgi:hypothetical protein